MWSIQWGNIREHLWVLLNSIYCLVQKYHIYVCLESSTLLIVLHPQKHKVNVPIKSLDKSLQKYYILFLFYFLCAPFTFQALLYREILSVFSRDLNLSLQKGVDSIERGSLPLSSAHMWQASSICIFTYIPRLFSLQDAALFSPCLSLVKIDSPFTSKAGILSGCKMHPYSYHALSLIRSHTSII